MNKDNTVDGEDPLTAMFAESMRHPANWVEWRKTTLFMLVASGVSKDRVFAAHERARRMTGNPETVDELLGVQEWVDEYKDNLEDRTITN